MSPIWILLSVGAYFCFLLGIAWYTSRNANNASYFLGNKNSPWYIVAFGLIGDSLSGVTYISVPGSVINAQFSYFQLVLGYLFGYWIISYVLLPVYYRMNLTSIYSYLNARFGRISQKTGSFYFLISRLLGAAGRLFLAAGVLQTFVFDPLHIPFVASVSIIIALILIYTYKGGIKTLVWTDTFQSAFLLLGVILSILFIANALHFNGMDIIKKINASPYSQVFFWDFKAKNYFWKQFLGGVFIAIAMTGLDQNMMQKNLSCKSLPDAQRNLNVFGFVVVLVNLFFLSLGALLYLYATEKNIALPENTDGLFPLLAFNHLGTAAGIVFIIGLTAATFSSADSVLTTLTTSFYIDFLKKEDQPISDLETTKKRHIIHVGFALILLAVILIFKYYNDKAIIDTILMIAGYTYGPLLGLFTFGLFSKRIVRDVWVPFICITAPVICYILSTHSVEWMNGYVFGNELLIVNGAVTFLGLYCISRKS